jgi:large subunit ribosomal protein L24
MKIKTNDKVKVLAGKDKGKTGKVIQTFPKNKKVVIENVNIMKKHIRSQKQGEKGQILELSAPFDVSNVSLICPKCNQNTRIGYKIEGKDKKRVCKKCNEIID